MTVGQYLIRLVNDIAIIIYSKRYYSAKSLGDPAKLLPLKKSRPHLTANVRDLPKLTRWLGYDYRLLSLIFLIPYAPPAANSKLRPPSIGVAGGAPG